MPIVTKLGIVVTYCECERVLARKSHDPRIMWCCEITWQTKTIISPLPQYLWPHLYFHNDYGCQNWQGDNLPWEPSIHVVTWSLIKWFCEIKWKTKNIIIHYHNTYGYQIQQGGEIVGKVIWSFNQVVFWGCVTNNLYFHLQRTHEHQTR